MIVIAACLFGAALYFPKTREAILDFLAPAMNPVLTWQTRGEMSQIARELQTINRQGGNLPAEGEHFAQWLTRNFQGGSSLDAWGNAYTLRIWRDSVGVISRGPDLTLNTADDVVRTERIQSQRNRRR